MEYCKHHPSEVVSNGVFDAPCGACECEMDRADAEWAIDPANTTRKLCGPDNRIWSEYAYFGYPKTCLDVEDNIPF